MLITILIFVVVLGLLVFVHELGHFLTAKKSGCQVDEFGFGFPPRLFGIKRGETIYSINAIPLGGFVKIAGEDGGEEHNPRSFGQKPLWQRLIILVAGVAMNLVLAIVLLSVAFGIGIPEALPAGDINARDINVQIAAVDVDSPADQAGFEIGDAVLAVNGQSVESVEELQSIVSEIAGQEIAVQLERGKEQVDVTVVPRVEHAEDEGPLGVALVRTGIVSYPPHVALWRGVTSTFFFAGEIVRVFSGLIYNLVTTGTAEGDFAGPVGIAVLTGQAARLGIVHLLQFTALLSINLAIINILPIPALDGGRVLFVLIEAIRKKKMSTELEGKIHAIGFMLLLLLMFVVTIQDVTRFGDRFARLWESITSVF
jgi:regulator of sigma E protease